MLRLALVGPSLVVCFTRLLSLRSLSSNQLDGTIPPQLSGLTKLQQLYADKSVVFLDNILISSDDPLSI